MGNIYILSDAVRSGKTTAIMEWLPRRNGTAGFLTPEVDGKRKLYDISANTYLDLETNATSCPDHTKVGGAIFDNQGFRYGQDLILNAVKQWPRWLVIDEVGILEMEHKQGWEPALTEVIKQHNDSENHCDLLLVVRDQLLEKAITHYALHAAIVLDKRFFLL